MTKDINKTRTNKAWSVNEIAFVVFAKYKGLTYPQMSQIMTDRTPGAINATGWKVESFHKGSLDPHDGIKKKIEKALIFESQVRSGMYQEEKSIWLEKIGRITGVKYHQSTPAPVTETPAKDRENKDNGIKEYDEKMSVEKIDILSFHVQVNLQSVERILGIIFGK